MLKLALSKPGAAGREAAAGAAGAAGGQMEGGGGEDWSRALDEMSVTRDEVLVLVWGLLCSTPEARCF